MTFIIYIEINERLNYNITSKISKVVKVQGFNNTLYTYQLANKILKEIDRGIL